ncbi:MAG: hypothetical protein J2P17_04165 [Mycobacterium sp.]|nr:hypothetical protein [Mycobacterium sp.]
MATTVAKNQEVRDPAETIERGLARIREISLDVQTEPLREIRLQIGVDLQIVYFSIRVPVAGGVTLRIPAMMTIKPRLYSPTQPDHL